MQRHSTTNIRQLETGIRHSLCIVHYALCIAVAMATASSHGAIFLKEDATGTGDGSSWTDAFTTWDNAMAAMRAIGNTGDATLYIAKGIYPASSSTLSADGATSITNANFAIHGGCRADFDGDLVRDPQTYQTLVTSHTKAGVIGAYWKRVTPDDGGYGVTTETVKVDGANFKLVGSDCRLQFPDFAGAHDTFQISSTGGSIPVFIGKGASGVLDGIRFVCCNRGGNRSGIIQIGGGVGDVTISNCVFAASNPQGGVFNDSGSGSTGVRTVVDCKILFNQTSYGAIGVTAKFGNAQIRNCAFVGNLQLNGYSMALVTINADANNTLDWIAEDCVFTRNLTSYNGNLGTQIIAASGGFRRMVITNNYMATSSSSFPCLISLRNNRYVGSGLLMDSLVADNTVVCRPASGTVGVLVSGHTTDRNSEPSVVNTIFRDNAILAPENTVAAANSCALGIVGNNAFATRSTWMTVEGCTFVSNRVEVANLAEDAKAVRSRGLLSYDDNSYRVQHGLANCTFFGPAEEGLFDVVQYGNQAKLLNVVNCVFALDDPDAIAAPFLSDSPSSLMVHDCAIQNWFPAFQPADFGALDGVKPDPLPFESVYEGPGDGHALRPASSTPGIRETCDIATNKPVVVDAQLYQTLSFAFRTREDGAVWEKLIPSAPGAIPTSPEPALDPLGAPRAFGTTTAGALQALTPMAETGSSLTIRRTPFTGGTLSHPFNQSAATGAPFAPVTAIPSAGGGFLGWLDEAGNPFSAANPLELTAPASNLVLTASFGTAAVRLTFSLDNRGTFDVCGLATTSLVCSAGVAFPEIPAFSANDGYVFVTWGELPTTVPQDDATYTARIVSKDLRRIYAAPDGSGDGTSWAQASGLAEAYEDAASYRGEVWLKEGVYTLASPLALRSNVSIVGGFAGNETAAAAANPDAHPTIISGNTSGGLYWKPNGADPGAGNRTAVWENGAFNPPNPSWADNYWQPASPSSANDAPYAFTEGINGMATNSSFRGVTFTGFSRAAIYSPSGAADGLEIEQCRFLANGTEASTSYSTIQIENSPFALRDCDFIGNFRVVRQILSTRPFTNEVVDCRFLDNVGGGFSTTISTNASFTVDRCIFARNYSAGTAPILALNSTWHFGLARFDDCAVVSNRIARGASSLFSFSCANNTTGINDYFGRPCLEFNRCEVSDNIANGTRALCFYFTGRYASFPVRDCHFARNVHAGITGQSDNSCGLLLYDGGYGLLTFVNCLVEHNSVASASNGAGLVTANNPFSRSALIGCTFADNTVTAPDPGNAADVNIVSDNAIGGHYIVNTVFNETVGGQKPVKGCSPSHIILWNTFTCGQGTNTMGEATISVQNHSSDDPQILRRSRKGPNGLFGRPVSAASPAAADALAVQRGNDGNYYVYRPWVTGNNAKPWIALEIGERTQAQSEALGLDPAAPSIPDAWGRPRIASGYSCGHVDAAPPRTMLILR